MKGVRSGAGMRWSLGTFRSAAVMQRAGRVVRMWGEEVGVVVCLRGEEEQGQRWGRWRSRAEGEVGSIAVDMMMMMWAGRAHSMAATGME